LGIEGGLAIKLPGAGARQSAFRRKTDSLMLGHARLVTISLAAFLAFTGLSAAQNQNHDQIFRFEMPEGYHVDKIIEDPSTHDVTILAHTDQQGGGRTDLVTVCDPNDRTVVVKNPALQTQDLWPLSEFGSCDVLVQAMRQHDPSAGH
jgi:hypothetical protein